MTMKSSRLTSSASKWTSCTVQLLCAFALLVYFPGSASSRYTEDTRYALSEMNKILRHLFPVMPERGPHNFIWPANFAGRSGLQGSDVQPQFKKLSKQLTQEQLLSSVGEQSVVGPMSGAEAADTPSSSETRTTLDAMRVEQEQQQKQQQRRRAKEEEEAAVAAILTDAEAVASAERVQVANGQAGPSSQGNQRPISVARTFQQPQQQQQHQQQRTHHQARPAGSTSGGHGGGPWRVSGSSPSLGKRGPECMRKCIAQGVLHPVQCHSLC